MGFTFMMAKKWWWSCWTMRKTSHLPVRAASVFWCSVGIAPRGPWAIASKFICKVSSSYTTNDNKALLRL